MTASVLMSIYNESDDEVIEAVMSVLNQTFSDFELIIIHDNPDRNNRDELLARLSSLDKRIMTMKNSSNIGLAMSMNRAFQESSGAYIIRMDADDVCEKTRFYKEIQVLQTNQWDVIFTNYCLIDDSGRYLDNGNSAISFKATEKAALTKIIFNGIIHHPTVAMTRGAFEKVGGYRNFPCSQDHDLWMRMLETGCRFFFLDEILLRYRIRRDSITGSNRIKQHVTVIYINNLLYEREKNGYDSFSSHQYAEYIQKNVTEKSKISFVRASEYLLKAQKTNMPGLRMWFRICAFTVSPQFRKSYLQKILYKRFFSRKFSECSIGSMEL